MKVTSTMTLSKPLISALNDCEKPLADFFIIYGASKTLIKGNLDIIKRIDKGIYKLIGPQVLESYPQLTKQKQLQSINLVLFTVTFKSYLCFPNGYKVLDAEMNKDLLKGYHSLNHVSITSDSGEKKYATTLLFYVLASMNY